MLVQLLVWLNVLANRLGDVLLAPIAWLPGWLSASVIAIVTGVVMLLVFKWTSNQTAIQQTRRRIKAHLLALSLFRDDLVVSLRSQGRLLKEAARLVSLSLVPMLVLFLPMCLILSQLSLWYQVRPLAAGEGAVITLQLADGTAALPDVRLNDSPGLESEVVSVRVPSQRRVYWRVVAKNSGLHELTFNVSGETVVKELAVGKEWMPVSVKRPAWRLLEVLIHPREMPFSPGSTVQSIEITYPPRESWTSGTDSWLIYWFLVSMAAAFAARPLLKVHI